MNTTQTGLFLVLALQLLCGLPGVAQAAAGEDNCYDVPEYDGVNAIPAVTESIHTASNGDTVVNDADSPPGEGPKIVVEFWEHPVGYQPAPGENPCLPAPTSPPSRSPTRSRMARRGATAGSTGSRMTRGVRTSFIRTRP